MAGICSATTDLTVYAIDDPAAVTADKLRRHAFRPIDDLKTEALAVGWTSIDGMLDTAWEKAPPEKGEWLCFALRVDKRTIPGAVLRKRYAEALKAEEDALPEDAERRYVSRKRRVELKEEVRLRLLPTIEPVPSVVDMAMNMHTGLLLVATGAKGVLGHMEELMASTFGVTPRRLEAGVDVGATFRQFYEGSRTLEREGHRYTLAYADQMTLAGLQDDNQVQVVIKNDSASAFAGLDAGLSVEKIRLSMERDAEPGFAWTFALNASLAFSGVKTPATESKPDDQNDADAACLEKLYLLEQLVGVVGQLFELK